MTILDLVRIIRTNLKLLLLSVLVGLLLMTGYTLMRPVLYQATSQAQVLAGSSQDSGSAMVSQQLSTGRATAYAQLASSPTVANRVVQLSGGALKPGEVSVSASVPDQSATLTMVATASTAEKAKIAANLAPKALDAEAKHIETLGDVKSTIFSIYQLSQAARPATPSSPNWPLNLAAGGILGLLVGTAIVVLRRQLDSRIRHTDELEKITGVGVLGVIPKAKNLESRSRGGLGSLGSTSESFRMLRTNLRYVSAEHPPRSLVVTSAVQSEGKSTVASNLARVLAAAGQHVVLVDTDLRRPVIHDTFDVDNAVGLTEVLTGQAALRDVIQPGDHKNLSLITAGRIPPNPSELLGSRRMSAVIDALSEEYFVVLDAPPLLPVTDGGLLAVAADGAAVVYHHGHTHREQIALCTKILDQVGARYFGSVLNMTPPKAMGSTVYGYGAGNYASAGYGYGYGYGHTDESEEAHALTPANEVRDLMLDAPAGTTPPASSTMQRKDAPAPARTLDVTVPPATPRAGSNANTDAHAPSRIESTSSGAAGAAGAAGASSIGNDYAQNETPSDIPVSRRMRRRQQDRDA